MTTTTAQIASHLNLVESAIAQVEEWANVIFVVAKGIGGRFVSKKIKTQMFTKQIKAGTLTVDFANGMTIAINGVNQFLQNKRIEKQQVKGMGEQWIVGGILLLSESEAQECIALKGAAQQAKIAEDAQLIQNTIEHYRHSGAVKLRQNCYSDSKWFLVYGNVQMRIYPPDNVLPTRPQESRDAFNNFWQLDLSEETQLCQYQTPPAAPTYTLTEPKGIPDGVDEIQAAQEQYAKASRSYEKAFEREEICEYPIDQSAPLKAKYPRAALYLKCLSYTYSSNYHKSTAGDKAVKLLLDGGLDTDINAILDNWLPAAAKWD